MRQAKNSEGMAMELTQEKVRLMSGDPDINSSVRALLFGELVKRAIPTVTHYLSDLYHDVQWLDGFITGPTTFFYGVRESGTHIGTDRDLIMKHSENVWRVDLVCERETWSAVFSLLLNGTGVI